MNNIQYRNNFNNFNNYNNNNNSNCDCTPLLAPIIKDKFINCWPGVLCILISLICFITIIYNNGFNFVQLIILLINLFCAYFVIFKLWNKRYGGVAWFVFFLPCLLPILLILCSGSSKQIIYMMNSDLTKDKEEQKIIIKPQIENKNIGDISNNKLKNKIKNITSNNNLDEYSNILDKEFTNFFSDVKPFDTNDIYNFEL